MTNTKKFLLALIPVFIMIGVMVYTGAQAGGDKNLIVKLELAPTIELAKDLLAPYDEDHLRWLGLNTQLDFVFILTYSVLFFFALNYFLAISKWKPLAFLAFVPGLLDVIENIFILDFLNHDFTTQHFAFYYWCVHIKWGMIPFLVIASLGLIGLLFYKKVKD